MLKSIQKLKSASLVRIVLVEVWSRTECATLEDAFHWATSLTPNAQNIRIVPARETEESVSACKADAQGSDGSATCRKTARRWQSAEENSAFAVAGVILSSLVLEAAHVN